MDSAEQTPMIFRFFASDDYENKTDLFLLSIVFPNGTWTRKDCFGLPNQVPVIGSIDGHVCHCRSPSGSHESIQCSNFSIEKDRISGKTVRRSNILILLICNISAEPRVYQVWDKLLDTIKIFLNKINLINIL